MIKFLFMNEDNRKNGLHNMTSDTTGAGSLPLPQNKTAPARDTDSISSYLSESTHTPEEGEDVVADNIDFEKLLQPSSSDYYYSDVNLSNRQLLDKVKSVRRYKKNSFSRSHSLDLDASKHLSERLRASAYRGPEPLRRDGSTLTSALKRGSQCDRCDVSDAESVAPTETQASQSRRFSFSCVDVREYERVAGDNPCVSKGVPLSIGWGYCQHGSIDLEEYEFNRGPARDKIEMVVPPDVRTEILRDEFGVPDRDMIAAMKEVTVTRKQRGHTVGAEPFEGLTEVAQSAKRKFKRFVKRTSNAKEQEKMRAQAQQHALNKYSKAQKNPEGAGVGKITNCSKVALSDGQSELDISDISSIAR